MADRTPHPSQPPPWHTHITIDLLAHVLNRSILHPYIAWLIPLCLRAITTPYHAPQFILACVWATLVTLLAILRVFNRRLAYGVPREVYWDEELVVITGGASGLGRILAQTFGMRGVDVVVLDLVKPGDWGNDEAVAEVGFYECDVGDAGAVERVKERIARDFKRVPTILINNAGVVNGKPLLQLSAAEVQRNFNVNLIAHFNTIRAFLPDMQHKSETGGTIVTIASVLGKLGASHLSDYTAAKAGLIAMHTSLRAELASSTAPPGSSDIRTILVTPGQLSTKLFAGVETPSSFFGPVVEPVELAREIVRMIDSGESGEISMPLYARWIDWLHVLPVSVQRLGRWMSGVDTAMEGVGKRKRN